jgi:oligosaccharide repeat unit polymerase
VSSFVILVCLLALLISIIKEKNIYNPVTIFSTFWGVIVFLASLRLYNLYEISEYTYQILLTAFLSYYFGFVFLRLIKPLKKDINNLVGKDNYVLNYNFLYILYGFTIIYLLFCVYNVIQLMQNGYSMPEIRRIYFSIGEKTVSPIFLFINTYIIKTLEYVFSVICFVDFFGGQKRKSLLLLTITVVILSSIVNGGRLIYYRFVIDAVIALLIYKDIYNSSYRGAVRIVICIVSFALIGMFILTKLRNTSINTLYVYFAGCIPHLNYRIELIKSTGIRTYGAGFFGGFLRPFFMVLDNIGLLSYPQTYLNYMSIIRTNVEQYVLIGDGVYYNAFVTPFFYFYLDFGVIGVVLGSAFYGAICSLSYITIKNKPNIKNISIYVLLVQEIFTSMIRWQLNTEAYFLAFVLLFTFVFKRKQSDNCFCLLLSALKTKLNKIFETRLCKKK